jgi:hypothetical protein
MVPRLIEWTCDKDLEDMQGLPRVSSGETRAPPTMRSMMRMTVVVRRKMAGARMKTKNHISYCKNERDLSMKDLKSAVGRGHEIRE